ncbi:MAG: DUF1232 domain-containing protein [Polyangiales bacterium]
MTEPANKSSPPRKPRGTLALFASPRGLWRYLTDKHAPKVPRVMALLAVLYVVSPFDLVPEAMIPVVGWLDDIGLSAAALAWLASKAARYERDNPEIKVEPASSDPSGV